MNRCMCKTMMAQYYGWSQHNSKKGAGGSVQTMPLLSLLLPWGLVSLGPRQEAEMRGSPNCGSWGHLSMHTCLAKVCVQTMSTNHLSPMPAQSKQGLLRASLRWSQGHTAEVSWSQHNLFPVILSLSIFPASVWWMKIMKMKYKGYCNKTWQCVAHWNMKEITFDLSDEHFLKY